MATSFDLTWNNVEKINVSANGSDESVSLDFVKDQKGNILWRRKTDTWNVNDSIGGNFIVAADSDGYIYYYVGGGYPEPLVGGFTAYFVTTITDADTGERLLDAEVSHITTQDESQTVKVNTTLKAEVFKRYVVEVYVMESEYHKSYYYKFNPVIVLDPVSIESSIQSAYNVTKEYISNYNSSSGYGVRLYFTSNAATNIALKITTGTSWLLQLKEWRGYHIFVNDGNKSWSDKATMLIGMFDNDNNFTLTGTWDETTGAWYYKSGNRYAIEFAISSGNYYHLRYLIEDNTSIYSDLLLETPQNAQYNYNGSVIASPFYSSDWTTVNSSGTSSPTIPGSYAYTLTKKSSMRIWSDDYTRLKSTKIRYAIISRGIIYYDDYAFTGSYTFTAGQTYSVGKVGDGSVTYSGTTSASSAGTHTYYATPTQYYQWVDGSTSAKSFTWTINKRAVTVPTAAGNYTYDRYSKSALSSYDSAYVSITGTLNATFVGSFTCYASLKYPNDTYWSSGSSSGTRAYNWSIAKRKINLPVAKSNLIYDGTHQVGVTNSSPNYVTITDNVGVNAGDYMAVASLDDPNNTEWNATPSYGDANIPWYISKYSISSNDLTVTLGKSGGNVRAKVTASKAFLSGLPYEGRFRKNTTSNYGNNKSGTIGNWVESTWKINGSDKYGFVVESVTGNSNINGWTGSKGSGSWYTG